MARYIELDALLAEIDRQKIGYNADGKHSVEYDTTRKILNIIDTLAEDHAMLAGRTKTIDEIKEALLSEVLPYFIHGGEADEVVAKLDDVLSRKK